MHHTRLATARFLLLGPLGALPVQLDAQPLGDTAVTLDGGGLNVVAEGGAFELAVGARLHADAAEHDDIATGVEAADGTEIRRARIELDGVVHGDWAWAAHVDFAGDETSIKDFAVEYTGLERVDLAVGHMKQPYSLALEMSSNDIPFIERGIDNDLIAPFVDRAVGVRAESGGERWFAAAGLFGEPIDASANGDQGWGTSGRFVFAPRIEPGRVLHLGVRAAYREPSDADSVRIRDETTHFSDLRIVDTGPLVDARSVRLFGPEAVYARGPWSIGAEYNDARIDRRETTDLDFDSWHVAATYALGGEPRASVYRIDAGEFKGLRPARDFDLRGAGRGTWELAARYASLDLNDGARVGGSEEALTLGANWYANANVRMLLSWTRILETDASNPLRAAADGLDIVQARAQLAF